MPLDFDKIKNAIDKSGKIPIPQPPKLPKAVGAYGGSDMMNENYDSVERDIPTTEEILKSKYGSGGNQMQMQTQPIQLSQKAIKKSGMPQNVLESILENPIIDTSGYSGVDTETIFGQQIPQQRQVMNEQSHTYQNNLPTPVSGGVDYSVISAIVSKAVRDEMSKITELFSNNEITVLKIGSKLTILDNKKRYYEADLKYKGTVE